MRLSALRLHRLGAIANLVLVAAMATAWAYSQPLFTMGDEMAHLDYAWQIWQGRLPVFENGLQLDPGFGTRAPVQWVAQHPPLYYLIQAPFVGPWLNAGNVLVAGYVGRAVNALFAVGLVAAVMWAVSAIAPKRTTLWLTAGTVTALYPVVVETAGTMYSDLPLAVCATLLIGLTARMAHRGPSPRRLILYAVVAVCTLYTRSAGGPVIAACTAALVVIFLIRKPRSWAAVAAVLGAAALAVGASAWFYLRNLALTGNLAGGHFDYLTHRVHRPLSEVVTRYEVWTQLLAVYGYELLDNLIASVLLIGLPVTAGVVLGIRHLLRARRLVPDTAIAVLLVGFAAGITLMQVLYVSSGGGASPRYLAPITVVVAFAIALALTAARRVAPVLVIGWMALAFLPYAAFTLANLGVAAGPNTGPVFQLPTAVALMVAVGALLLLLVVQMGLAGWFDDVIRLPGEVYAPRRAVVDVAAGPAGTGPAPTDAAGRAARREPPRPPERPR